MTISRSFAKFENNIVDSVTYNRDMEVLFRAVNMIAPAGVILPYGGTTAPTGWLVCDGTSYPRLTYPDLYKSIGTSFGTADGTHFNVPDFRGRFLRGWANGQTTDPDRATRTAMTTGGATGDNIGSVQADQYKSHTHPPASGASNFVTDGADGALIDAGAYFQYKNATGASGGNETRPVNANVNFIIKY